MGGAVDFGLGVWEVVRWQPAVTLILRRIVRLRVNRLAVVGWVFFFFRSILFIADTASVTHLHCESFRVSVFSLCVYLVAPLITQERWRCARWDVRGWRKARFWASASPE